MSSEYGGAEIFFTAKLTAEKRVLLETNIVALPQYSYSAVDWWTSDEAGVYSLEISSAIVAGFVNVVCKGMIDGVLIEESSWPTELTQECSTEYRCIVSNDSVSVYFGGIWVYTYVFGAVRWPDSPNIEFALSAIADSGFLEITGINFVELSDSREAVFIDYEATSDSAIQSIIQQRPIQIFQNSDRSASYTYSAIKGVVTAHHISSYDISEKESSGVSSDGLVYYADVTISVSEQTAKEVGFITKLYRLSELNNGATYAAARMQKLALERMKGISLVMRLDPRIEVGDNLLVDFVTTGTLTRVQESLIVEDASIMTQNGNYSMRIQARRKL